MKHADSRPHAMTGQIVAAMKRSEIAEALRRTLESAALH